MQPQTPIIGSDEQIPPTPSPATITPQPIVSVGSPQNTEFTSNPFLSFGKGLGAGLNKSPGAVMGLSALFFVAFFGIYIGSLILTAITSSMGPLVSFLIFIVAFLVLYIVLGIIMGRGALVLIKGQFGESVSLKESGELLPFKYSLQLVGFYFLYSFAILIGLMLFIIPGLIIMARWSLGLFVIAEEKVGPIEAIKKSWELTKGNTWNMLGAISSQNIILGGAMVLTIGTLGASANRYHELKALSISGVKNTTTHWLNYVMTIVPFLLVLAYVAFIIAAGLSAYSNIQDSAEESGAIQTYSESQLDQQSSSQQYCYFNGDYSDENTELACVNTIEECKANQFCSDTYMLTDEQYN